MDLSDTSMWICPLAPEEQNGCDNHLIIAGVSTINTNQRRNKARQLRPPELCSRKECGLRHSPDLCCICSAPHPIDKCWHLIGLPEARKQVRDQFQISKDQGKLEHKSKTVRIQSSNIDIRHDVPTDLAPPEDRVAPATASDPTPSAQDVEAAMDTYQDMLERESLLDATFSNHIAYSSMVKVVPQLLTPITDEEHALVDIEYPDEAQDSPLVPEQAADVLACLPPEIMNRKLGMQPRTPLPSGQFYMHVDTGCTDMIVTQSLMDPDTIIDTSGTTLSAGTASDAPNSNGAVTAIGFLGIFLITTSGNVEHIGCTNAMEVSGFPRHSFSLSHLRRLGYRASHAIGENVKIYTPSGREFAIPVITEGEQDYIIVHTNNPQADSGPTTAVRHVDISGAFHPVVTSVATVNLWIISMNNNIDGHVND